MLHLKFTTSFRWLAIALLSLAVAVSYSAGVVVDGMKDKEISATKNQSSEESMIDSFNTKTCGIADPNYNEHEFVNMAREGQFPWMVSFQIKIPVDSPKRVIDKAATKTVRQTRKMTLGRIKDVHFCCGSFISDRWILSAAHCFAPDSIKNYLANDKLKVVAGSHKVSSRAAVNRNLTIKRIFYHDRFDKSMPVGFDIALVELDQKVEFTHKRSSSPATGEQDKPFMNTICLPLKNKRYKFNETARVAGWGLSNDQDSTSMPSKLLTTDIQISDKDKCVAHYVKSLNSTKPKIQRDRYDDFICASHKGTRDACQSDSGGPLMEYAAQKAVVVGIVSYGIGCATKGVPGLYTRTSAYINWIKEITKYGKDASAGFKLIEAVEIGSKEVKKVEASIKPSVNVKPKILLQQQRDKKRIRPYKGWYRKPLPQTTKKNDDNNNNKGKEIDDGGNKHNGSNGNDDKSAITKKDKSPSSPRPTSIPTPSANLLYNGGFKFFDDA